jgi:hypothetical protein
MRVKVAKPVKLPLDISDETRELAKAWYKKEDLNNEEMFFGFMHEWSKLKRSTFELKLAEIFTCIADRYRSDFIVDLIYAGMCENEKMEDPLVYWLPNKNGSHMFTEKGLFLICSLAEFKQNSNLYLLSGSEIKKLGKAKAMLAKRS